MVISIFTCTTEKDISSLDRKSYLTRVILPRLSHEGCTLVVLELTRHSRQVTSSYHVASRRIQDLLGVFFKHENVVFNGEQEKASINHVRVG